MVSSLAQDASALHEVVTERAAVAERISSKVRILDLEQSRVKECIDRVQAITELKDALINVFQAIEKADWEAATRHIQRANGINPEMIRSQFAEAVVVSDFIVFWISLLKTNMNAPYNVCFVSLRPIFLNHL